ncbi:hypothetical protein ABZ783_36530 [Micromonospora sp. NPDC047738]|uniref:hypothetical protein n=1 Tax=Micromonospora sp. NPDC047738 TaxID=3155741 RepID=UPI0033F572F8
MVEPVAGIAAAGTAGDVVAETLRVVVSRAALQRDAVRQTVHDVEAASVQPTAPITAVPRTKLPGPATGVVPLSGKETLVGELPLTFSQPKTTAGATAEGELTAVRVQVLNEATRKASGATAVLVALSRADGVATPCQLHVRLNYTGFSNAYGGDYANRVMLDEYPACVLTTPEVRTCRNFETLKAVRWDGKLSTDITLAGDGSLTVIAI